MFQFLRSLFERANTKSSPPKFAFRFSSADAVHIEHALNMLPTIGLRPTLPPESYKEKAQQIARANEGIFCFVQPTLMHWILFALSAESRAFENAIWFGDHCYDGLTAPDLADMIRDVIGMASSEWRVEDVRIIDPSNSFELGSSIDIQVVASPPVTSFKLQLGKNFDWSLIYSLNERLPKSGTKKFAILLDGSANIVYLEHDQIEKLNEYCGGNFFFEE